MNVLDLFSGIGGFTIGLERAGLRTIAMCERDPFARAVLAQRFGAVGYMAAPDAETAVFANLRGRVNVIAAGFPCQDVSFAGKGKGLTGKKSRLWREVHRAVDEIRPDFVILENSAALLTRGLDTVLGALAALGYDAVWHCIPAAYVGASHLRDRIWIVGYRPNATGARFVECWRLECEKDSIEERRLRYWPTESRPPRVADGVRHRTHRNRVCGEAVVPHIPEIIGRAIMKSRVSI